MTHHCRETWILSAGLLFAGLQAAPLAAQDPGSRCCARFDYLLEKTIFKVDAVRLELAFTDGTPARVAALLARSAEPDSPELRDSIAAEYLAATGAMVRFTFERSFGLDRFLRANRNVMERLVEAGVLSAPEFRALDAENVKRFQVLAGTGIRDGDRLEHRVDGERVTTRYLDVEGAVRIDEVQVGDAERRALLGSLFGPKSDFRDGLLDQVLSRAWLEEDRPGR
jgi:hypothetical protein